MYPATLLVTESEKGWEPSGQGTQSNLFWDNLQPLARGSL
jgi:hypothetical protein